jgi:Zn-finger nucleic acid-binding protein
MAAFEWEGVEIDHCAFCGGTWLDAGELEMILELSGLSPAGVETALNRAEERGRTPRRCPRCPAKLREIAVDAPDTVILDRCPRGHGLWFDRGEMEKVIRTGTGGDEAVVARFLGNLFGNELHSRQGGN